MTLHRDQHAALVEGLQDASEAVITTPAGSTIQPVAEGGYWVCDADRHCLQAPTLWQAQQWVQWAEVHHQPLPSQQAANAPC